MTTMISLIRIEETMLCEEKRSKIKVLQLQAKELLANYQKL
jgi:hypothetical protein